MPPNSEDLVRAWLTHLLNERDMDATDHGTHVEMNVDGKTYKITVERTD